MWKMFEYIFLRKKYNAIYIISLALSFAAIDYYNLSNKQTFILILLINIFYEIIFNREEWKFES